LDLESAQARADELSGDLDDEEWDDTSQAHYPLSGCDCRTSG
jgi:hypothetical protein